MKLDNLVWSLLVCLVACQGNEQTEISFNRDIRPIFNTKCLRCHGGVKANGNFSLLFEEDAFNATESGNPAIIRGSHRKSELYQRLVSDDPELRMPYENEPLSAAEIDLIARWIDQGAHWEKHWAYIPPAAEITVPPSGKEIPFLKNEIDFFILRKLEENNLSPNAQADYATLIRRLFLDLTGLPPSPAEVEKYTGADENSSINKVVDDLLNSPHYGERFASMWLDLARYADTKGYEKDQNRQIWKYRDYVIHSFNEDKPFDQFSIEQLAGDLLPDPTDQQLIATAFHRNSMSNDEGGTDDEEFRVASVTERVNTTYEVWQSTTMACVQCHGHPYDPFRNEDFYRSMAYFNNAEDHDNYNENPKLYLYSEENGKKASELISEIYSALPEVEKLTDKRNIYTERTSLFKNLHYRITEAEDYHQASPFIEIIWPDLDMLWQTQDSSWIKFENIGLNDVERIGFLAATELDLAGEISVHLDSLNGEEIGRVKITKTGSWEGWQGRKPPQKELSKEFNAGIKETEGTHDLYFRFWVGDTYIQHLFYLDKIIYYEKNAPYRKLNRDLQKKLNVLYHLPAISTPVIRKLPEDKARKTYVFDRGSWLSPGAEVPPQIPGIFLGPENQNPEDRLAFARWLFSAENPLTARVIVNRIWEQIFGRGLVETMEEFGSQGEPPTHPELLDWLANRLVHRYQWRLKPLIRDIVTSGTYQQESEIDSLKLELDPDNRWLSRGARVRLSSEQIRDQILTVSDLLNAEIGGPSVIIPELRISTSNTPAWALTDASQFYRRSLYIFWKRTDPFRNLIAFDSPDRTTCTSHRIRTNTPLQALNLLNDETYQKAAFAMALRINKEENTREKINKGYLLCTGEKLNADKYEVLLKLYEMAVDKYRENQLPEIIRNFDTTPGEKRELAALTLVANAFFNLDEFIVKK